MQVSEPKFSIIIPSYSNVDGLRSCLKSIVDYTNLDDTEVIVVANGAPDETKEVLELYRYFPVKLIWIPEAVGYTAATNIGIKAVSPSTDFLVLMNDDCVLLSQYRDAWKQILLQPFNDPKMAITGPVKHYCHAAEREFLIFFLVMIRKSVMDEIGILDEVFSPGSGEDTDWCCRAVDAGWKMEQTPPDPGQLVNKDTDCQDLPEWKRLKMWSNEFPLYHDGNATFSKIPEIYEPAMQKNHATLQERYGKKKQVNTPTGKCAEHNEPFLDGVCWMCLKQEEIDIWEAISTDGWFGADECAQLARWVKALPPKSVVVEIGSWHGRSSRAIAANLSEGSVLYCVDTWIGSSGEPEMHGSAHYDRGDHAYTWWMCNLWKYIQQGKVIPIRAHSENAAHTLNHLGLKIDLLFVDADHSYEGFQTDVKKWAPLMKEGALWCGHDYYPEGEEPFAWIGVREGVQKYFPDAKKVATSLWWSQSKPIIKQPIFDAFLVNDELDLLELRFNELNSVVDRWIITESPITHANKPKPLYFNENKERFAPWLGKITHIIIDDFGDILNLPDGPDKYWAIERHQRNALMRGLTECRDDDVILIGDCDEIPRAEAVASYRPEMGLTCLEMSLHYGYMNLRRDEPWRWSRLLPYGMLKAFGEAAPCIARYNWNSSTPNYNQVIENGGWHFSFMGGPDEWVRKLEATPHQEYNKPEFKDKDVLQQRALNGEDLLGRGEKYNWVQVDDSYPKFVRENIRKFVDNKFIYEGKMHPESWQFIKRVKDEYPDWFKGKKVLEVGSLDINGSVRQFFEDCDYTGIDIAEGKGVDRVCLAHQFFRDETYDVVISSEMLEHDQFWYQSLKQMYRNLKHGGLLIITCAGPKRPEHGTERTNDAYSSPFTAASNHYRNISQEDLLRALPHTEFSECVIGYERGEEDLNFYGFKILPPFPKCPRCHNQLCECLRVVVPEVAIPLDEPFHLEMPAAISKRGGPDKMGTVTAEVSTKDRYFTTLPLALSAIATQTRKPEKIVIYDDGDQQDLREISPYSHLLKMFEDLKIEWEVVRTPRLGQVFNHQHCLDNAKTDWIWRVDDDEVPLPTCLETLLNTTRDYGRGDEVEQIGAVAGLVHQPMDARPLPDFLDGSLKDVQAGLNMQWFQFNSHPREVEHLYSTFIYRVDAAKKAGGYPKGLSTIGHREETIFSHQLKRAGYKLLVTPHAKTYHLRESTGGIRSFQDHTLWEKDEEVFQSYLQEWGMGNGKPHKMIIADCGLGDHLLLKGVWPDIRRRNPDKEYTLALCFPEVFEDVHDIRIISIADAKLIVGPRYEDYSLYKWCWDRNWNGPISDAMVEFWG